MSTTHSGMVRGSVETLRKPSTGLKLVDMSLAKSAFECRDTQKTQHGIETYGSGSVYRSQGSRHSENPARD